MDKLLVVKCQVAGQPHPCFCDRFVVVKIHVFVLDGAPQTLDKNVVQRLSPAPPIANGCSTVRNPSFEMRTSAFFKRLVNASEVN